MRKFVWRLQRVLDVKKKQEQIKRAELLELTEKLARTHRELLTQQKVLDDIILQMSKTQPDKRLKEQEFFLKYSETTNELIKSLKKKVAELESQQKEKIIEVLRLRRFKESLEKMREEAKRQFITEQERLEQKEMDERATIDFSRRVMEKIG